MEATHDDVDEDQHSTHNDVELDPEVCDAQGKVGDHGAHETEHRGQLGHEEVLLHQGLAGGTQGVALAARLLGRHLQGSTAQHGSAWRSSGLRTSPCQLQ